MEYIINIKSEQRRKHDEEADGERDVVEGYVHVLHVLVLSHTFFGHAFRRMMNAAS